ncbi:kinesin family member 6 isoform x1 [Lasius niger]|uniref:Kinesin family member 6 isoform x1 n=1 Tax=Lasius niger TaxID=67767 RepID=A0A0J7JZR1_LASNI|nr:kinesin family member 6 isoform x1 [Lasius niger]
MGPYLRVANHWSFEVNEVILPTTDFLSKAITGNLTPANPELVKYKLSMKLVDFLQNRCLEQYSQNKIYYLYEALRNLGASEANVSTSHNQGFTNMRTMLQQRFNTINVLINNSKSKELLQFITMQQQLQGEATPLPESPFYQLLMTCMHYAEMETGSATTTYQAPNVSYDPQVGFYCTQEICYPVALILNARLKANDKYLQIKIKSHTKKIVGKTLPQSCMPDYNSTIDIVTGNSPFSKTC